MMTIQMSPSEAAAYAPTWGSMMTSGDPGACMYGFDHNCRPQNEQHRTDTLAWMAKCRLNVLDRPADFDDDELETLDAFVAFITERSIKPETPDSTINRGVEFTQGNLVTMTYGDVLDAIEATDSDPFDMSIRCKKEWAVIAAAVNVGIDSHLEAISNAADEFDNGTCQVTPHNLCILLRRLADGPFETEDMWDAANTIQGDILLVLGFDDCGKYVGREANGLD